jgi:hypothetical protein
VSSEGVAQKRSQKNEMYTHRRQKDAHCARRRCGSHVLKGERCTVHSHPEKIGALAGNQKRILKSPSSCVVRSENGCRGINTP